MEGFIQLHRKMLEWEWYDDPNTMRLFIHLLLKANYKPKKWRGIDIGIGEVLTGRITLSDETGLTQQQIRTSLDKLKSTNEITIKPTNRYSIIKLTNYSKHQQVNQQTTQQATNNQPTDNQQITTTNKDNKDNKETIYKGGQSGQEIKEELIKLIRHRNNLYKEKREVTDNLLKAYKIKRKIYTKEQVAKGYLAYNESKRNIESKQFLLTPLSFIESKKGFIQYL